MVASNLHAAAKGVLDASTYAGVVTPNTTTPMVVSKGGTSGITITNTFYEFGYKTTRRDAGSINVYSRTGQDGYQTDAGNGALAVRTFDIASQSMCNDRIEIYNDATYAVLEYHCENMSGEVWIWTYERLRSDPSNKAAYRVCFLRSTDGLTGRSFAAPVVQSSIAFGVTCCFHSVIYGAANGSIKYLTFGAAAPAGLRRALINQSTGELTNLTVLWAKPSSTEGSEINIDRDGTIISLSRLDSGGYLQHSVSTDWGLTFSAPVDSLIGAATGAKVTPTVVRSANRSRSLTVAYNDRGSSSRDRACSLNTQAQALAVSYNPSVYVFTTSTQGNSRLQVIDQSAGLYLYVCAKENGEPAGTTTTTLMYSILKDQYSAYNVPPNPWR